MQLDLFIPASVLEAELELTIEQYTKIETINEPTRPSGNPPSKFNYYDL